VRESIDAEPIGEVSTHTRVALYHARVQYEALVVKEHSVASLRHVLRQVVQMRAPHLAVRRKHGKVKHEVQALYVVSSIGYLVKGVASTYPLRAIDAVRSCDDALARYLDAKAVPINHACVEDIKHDDSR
jgi:hypothetical protein